MTLSTQTGVPWVPLVWCDPCIAPLVSAMNTGGIRTVASCCGHDRCPSTVILDDDRFVVLMTRDQYEQIAGVWPGINDEPPTTRVVSIRPGTSSYREGSGS